MNVALRGLQKIFHFVTQIRNYFFNHGLFRIREVKVPVVSVGNITFGGTGKTPTVIKIAEEIRNNGFKVVIISRGYKRWSFFSRIVSDTEKIRMSLRRAGDEPYLLANKLKGVPVIVSKKRFKGASKAIKKFNPDIILLDDGFQHRKLKRTVDVVLIDSPEILANNTLMREPVKNLRRADMVVFTKYDQFKNAEEVHQQMVDLMSCPVFHARYKINRLKNEKEEQPVSVLDKQTVWLIAGIGKPDYFKHIIEQAGSYVSRTFFYNDHAGYSRWKIRRILRKFKSSSAKYLITTEKDWHKLKRWIPPDVPCYYLEIDIDINRLSLFMKQIYDAAYLHKLEEVIE